MWVSRTELKPWADNPRKNDGEPVAAVMESIRRFGFAAPIVARRADGMVIAGHTRLKAAEALGLDQVPVRWMDLDPANARLLALADNKLNEKADWDSEKLALELEKFSLEDVALAGWDSAELEKMGDDQIDEATDQSDQAKTDFAVLIECTDEGEQLAVIERCGELGWKCRALI